MAQTARLTVIPDGTTQEELMRHLLEPTKVMGALWLITLMTACGENNDLPQKLVTQRAFPDLQHLSMLLHELILIFIIIVRTMQTWVVQLLKIMVLIILPQLLMIVPCQSLK